MFHSGLASTWCLPGRLPVISEARAGVQIAVGVKQWVKAKPDSPIASMTGVRAWGVTQAADCVGAVLVGHDDQDVAYVVGNVSSLVGHWCAFSSLVSRRRWR